VEIPHFPHPQYAFIWRNWQLVETGKLAQILDTTEVNVRKIGALMGLPSPDTTSSLIQTKGYITLVRRNWHLLPYEQLLELLEIPEEEMYERLREEDFLFVKLGNLKPNCPPLAYHDPTPRELDRLAEIKRTVQTHFGDDFLARAESPRFEFVETLSALPQGFSQRDRALESGEDDQLRMIHSYFASFGDTLMDETSDPYPDGLLARLQDVGVNGIWLHVVLRHMAPGGIHFPEFGTGHEQRLKRLQDLCQRAGEFGIGVYLYLNEPRAMPESFFAGRPEVKGVAKQGVAALCTSSPRVQEWVENAVAHVFRSVPELAGAFTITASENLTHCWSHWQGDLCLRCQVRDSDEVIAEINELIARGISRGNPQARAIAWDWGWNKHGDASTIVRRLPKTMSLMSVSEWSKPISRGGIETEVGEYSLSAVGPGPRAQRHWEVARETGLHTVAKVQFSTTWELASVPYLPALNLVAEHWRNLQEQKVDGQMLSWSVGGYPSPNLQVAHRLANNPSATNEELLQELARDYYGNNAAEKVFAAWAQFSRALQEFPYHRFVLYRGPQQRGPANLLYQNPTGFKATMLGLPYDDLDSWRGPYPAEVFTSQFEKLSKGWGAGMRLLKEALKVADRDLQSQAEADFRVAEAAGIHFKSVANQSRFIGIRNEMELRKPTSKELRESVAILDSEIDLAKRLWDLSRQDSRIGFEATNHYFYVPIDLAEKVVNCEYLKNRLDSAHTIEK